MENEIELDYSMEQDDDFAYEQYRDSWAELLDEWVNDMLKYFLSKGYYKNNFQKLRQHLDCSLNARGDFDECKSMES